MESLICHFRDGLAVGQTDRYLIGIDWSLYPAQELYIRVKNRTKLSGKVAYLLGPFVLYCDARPLYPAENCKPQFKTNIEPQNKFNVVLKANEGRVSDDGKSYWIIDVVSEILFSTESKVEYELILGTDQRQISRIKYSENYIIDGFNIEKVRNDNICEFLKLGGKKRLINEKISSKPKHLVIITHGLYSNVPNDMMYIMESLHEASNNLEEELVVDGYRENVCKTELGIKALGIRLAKYIVDEKYDTSVVKISFIGHSLGGLIQTFAIAYISLLHPWFFEKVRPINYISLATPFLGLYTDVGNYVKKLLSSGALGQTGEDLRFHKHLKEKNLQILFLLSGEPAHSILKRFLRRTIYANTVNDGVVPLVSSSLLFLKYEKILFDLKLGGDVSENDVDNITNWRDFKTSARYYEYKKMYPKSRIFRRVSFNSTVGNLVTPEAPKDFTLLDSSEVIVHDELYSSVDIAAPDDFSLMLYKGKYTFDKYQLQELIARRWHAGKSWRKVLVNLGGDAHNSINVRRRYGNAYGWKVVKHLIDNHFTSTDQSEPQPILQSTADPQQEPNIEFAWLMKEEKTHMGFITKTSKTINPLGRWI
ncbi:putative lipase [Nakaseomyces bracarensis]|uniref:Lipase n=1 Tax=Nakaseomyces bracarensis TaxID=273131 RepID=A0ABR4NMG8_9SACH